MEYNQDNIFAKILRDEIPSYKIFETEHCLAILDAFPLAKGHALLIPKAPVISVLEMSPEQASAVACELPRLCNAVKRATNASGVTVVSNIGKSSGQIVFHAHIHVIPRFDNDNLIHYNRKHEPLTKVPGEAEQIVAALRAAYENDLQSSN